MSLSEHTVAHPDGGSVHYWQDGDPTERPIILLHGDYGNAYTQWSDMMPLLAESYFVVAPDLPGYGQSSPLSPLRLEKLVNWLRGFLKLMDFNAAVLVGSSHGALLARMLAVDDPAVVPVLILINGGIEPSVAPAAKLLAAVPGIGGFLFDRISGSLTQRTRLEGMFVNQNALTPPLMTAVQANRKALAALMRGMMLSPEPKLATPAVPVLILWGEDDPLVPVRVAEHLNQVMPGSELIRIENCGHLPQIEQPEVVASQIGLYLKRITRGGRARGAGLLAER
jgi:pimeloyl-ACP methyl ester carboxylesterase